MFGDFTWTDLLYVFTVYIAGMFVAILIGRGFLFVIGIQAGTVRYLLYSPLLAAILEPVLSKLLPALVIVYWATNRRDDLLPTLHTHPLLIGAYGGAGVGIVEAVGKVVMQTGMYGGVDSVTTGVILAALGHVLYGGIVGNAVYREEETRVWHNTLTATTLAIIIHLSWNGYNVLQLVEQL